MAALVLAALTVKALEFRKLPDERSGGGLRRTLNFQLRGRTDRQKRAWAGVLYAADTAELTAILAAANPDQDINVSGDAIGGTVACRVSVIGEIPYIRSGAVWYYTVPVSVREV